MLLYLTIWISSLFFGIFTEIIGFSKKITIAIYFLMFLPFVGLRHEVGADWLNYIEIYEHINFDSDNVTLFLYEPAYVILNMLSHYTGFGIYLVNIICALIFIGGLFKFCAVQTQYRIALILSIPYFMVVIGMGYTRQSAALGIIMWGYSNFKVGKILHFVFTIILASLFHRSALLLFFILPFIFKFKVSSIKFLFLAAAVGLFFSFQSDAVSSLFSLYIIEGMESEGGWVRLVINLIAACCYFIIRSKCKERFEERVILYDFLASFIILLFVASFFLPSTAIDRFSLYFAPMQLVAFSNFNFRKNSAIKYIFVGAIFSAYSAFLIGWFQYSVWANCCWVPYKNILLLVD